MSTTHHNSHQRTRRGQKWLVLAAGAIFVVGAVLAWRFTSLAQFASPAKLAKWMTAFSHSGWAPLVVTAIYVLAGFVVFPLTVLIAATALVFDPPLAFTCAMVGSLANACALYGAGRYLLSDILSKTFGALMQKTAQALQHRGIPAVAVLRTIPVAPFTMVNLAAGALRIRFRDYVIGTALGILPGVTMLTAFGEQLRAALEKPTLQNMSVLAAVIALWIGVSLGLQRLSSRWKKQHEA